jgi:hypothetical protein
VQVALVTGVAAACALHVLWALLLPARWRRQWGRALRLRFGLGPGRIGRGSCEGCGGGCDAAAIGDAMPAEEPIRGQPRRHG